MPYRAFHELFPDFGPRETRTLTVPPGADLGLPAGEYLWVELFCDKPECDCRRVMFNIFSLPRQRDEAVIAWGWETPNFYAKWLGISNPYWVDELQGPILNMASPQLEHADTLLRITRTRILSDPAYVERVKRHYKMFRDKLCLVEARTE